MEEYKMECPHCEYLHGWDSGEMKNIEGEKGEFYKLPIDVERDDYDGVKRLPVHACPSCNKMFIERF